MRGRDAAGVRRCGVDRALRPDCEARRSMRLRCIACGTTYPADKIRYTCDCGNLLAVERDAFPTSTQLFDERRASRKTIDQSGVWRFREAVLDIDEAQIITHPEGSTRLYERNGIFFKHEGE